MITFLALPRAFVGEFDALQRAAIDSWKASAPGCQVLLFGNDDVNYFRTGAPLVDKVFTQGEQLAQHEWLCFVSADVRLEADMGDVLDSLSEIERPFVIGQRWDVEPGAPRASATLHAPCGVDYFLYRRGTLGPVLPFTVRGGGGDNWLVWKALKVWHMTVIDATEAITALHTNHSHPEWQNGKAGRQGSPEQQYNHKLAYEDGMRKPYGVDSAPWALRNGEIKPR